MEEYTWPCVDLEMEVEENAPVVKGCIKWQSTSPCSSLLLPTSTCLGAFFASFSPSIISITSPWTLGRSLHLAGPQLPYL